MPYSPETRDLTGQYLGYNRDLDTFRPVANASFLIGSVLNLASQDLQIYPDYATVQPIPISAAQGKVMGVVADTWPGFAGSLSGLTPTTLSPSSAATVRGTVGVDIVLRGYHPAILVDQSGAGAVALADGLPLVGSRATIGYAQGAATATSVANLGIVAVQALPAAGLGSALTAGALAQAASTTTIAGTPTTGDVYTFTLPAPYSTAAPGVAQFITFTVPPLTAAQATSVTTAAAAAVAYLNTQPSYTRYYTASNSLGVVSHTVNGLATPFAVTFGSGSTLFNSLSFGVSGSFANNATGFPAISVGVTGVSTNTVTTQFAGGTGYKGPIPGYVVPS